MSSDSNTSGASGEYLPEFRVLDLQYYDSEHPEQSRLANKTTTPWENKQLAAKENPAAISELHKDGLAVQDSAQTTASSPSRAPHDKYSEFKGLVRMTKDQYDHVLKSRPGAALKYVDEEDGELISVGSSFELEQKLREPVDGQEPVKAEDFSKCIPVLEKPRHSFSVNNTMPVKSIWRGWESETHIRRWGISQGNSGPCVQNKADTLPSNYQYFPHEPTKLSGVKEKSRIAETPYQNRWASYADLSSSFDRKASGAATGKDDSNAISQDEPQTEQSAPASAEQTEPARSEPNVSASDISSETAPSATATEEIPRSAIDVRPRSVELALSESVISLFGQFGSAVAEAFKPGSDASEQLRQVADDLPQNLDLAFRAGASAVEHFVNVVNAAKSGPAASVPEVPSAENGTRSSDALPKNDAIDTKKQDEKVAPDDARLVQSCIKPYQAEKIIGRRDISYGRHPALVFRQYLVRWVGRPQTDDIWYDEENLVDCGLLISNYEASRRDTYGNMFNQVTEASEMHQRTGGDKMITHARSLPAFERRQQKSLWSESTFAKQAQSMEATLRSEPAVASGACGLLIDTTPSVTLEQELNQKLQQQMRASSDDAMNRQRLATQHRFPSASASEQEAADKLESMSRVGRRKSSEAETDVVKNYKSPMGVPSLIDDLPDTWRIMQPIPQPAPSTSARSLKQRRSWHPNMNSGTDRSFNFSTADVMARYPSLSQIEGAPTTGGLESVPKPSSHKTASAMPPAQVPSRPLRSSKSVEFQPHPPPPPPSQPALATVPSSWNPSAPRPSVAVSHPPRRAATVRERRVRWPDTVSDLLGEQSRRNTEAAQSAWRDTARSRTSLSRANTTHGAREHPVEGGAHDLQQRDIERRLIEMGFTRAEAEAAAAGAGGNLEAAIDTLEEDQAAWKGRRGARMSANYSGQMPGAWEQSS